MIHTFTIIVFRHLLKYCRTETFWFSRIFWNILVVVHNHHLLQTLCSDPMKVEAGAGNKNLHIVRLLGCGWLWDLGDPVTPLHLAAILPRQGSTNYTLHLTIRSAANTPTARVTSTRQVLSCLGSGKTWECPSQARCRLLLWGHTLTHLLQYCM